MRQIKFRAWCTKKIPYIKSQMIYNVTIFGNSDQGWASAVGMVGGYGERNTLMQYTGLKDKNGKEIYEGDIIDFAGLKPLEIIWEETRFRTKLFTSEPINLNKDGCESFAEVIGNIYENGELLGE